MRVKLINENKCDKLPISGGGNKMKFKVRISNKETKKQLEDSFAKIGFEITEDADLIIIEEEPIIDILIGKLDEVYYPIKTENIILIESFGHDIFCITVDGNFKIKEKLKYLEYALDSNQFVRINKSMIINKNKIKSVSATVGLKFKIILVQNKVVYVNRTYYYIFKEFIGI